MAEHCGPMCPFAGCPSCEYAGGATVSVTYGARTDRLGSGHESVPAPASTGRGRGRTDNTRGRFDNMSVPTRGGPGNPSNQLPARWFARVDGCPMCVENVEAPHRVEETENSTPDDPGFYAWYRCQDCQHEWRTAWSDIEWEGLFA